MFELILVTLFAGAVVAYLWQLRARAHQPGWQPVRYDERRLPRR